MCWTSHYNVLLMSVKLASILVWETNILHRWRTLLSFRIVSKLSRGNHMRASTLENSNGSGAKMEPLVSLEGWSLVTFSGAREQCQSPWKPKSEVGGRRQNRLFWDITRTSVFLWGGIEAEIDVLNSAQRLSFSTNWSRNGSRILRGIEAEVRFSWNLEPEWDSPASWNRHLHYNWDCDGIRLPF